MIRCRLYKALTRTLEIANKLRLLLWARWKIVKSIYDRISFNLRCIIHDIICLHQHKDLYVRAKNVEPGSLLGVTFEFQMASSDQTIADGSDCAPWAGLSERQGNGQFVCLFVCLEHTMARPAEITDAEVIAAGRALEAEGENVNPFRLHRGVGRRGRPDRLIAVWSAFKAQVEPSSTAAEEPASLPASAREDLAALTVTIGDRLDKTVRAIADQLAREAKLRAQVERDSLAREREAITAAERDAVEAVTALVDQVDGLREDNERLTVMLRQAQVATEAAEILRRAEAERLVVVEERQIQALAEAARAGERSALAERRSADLEAELVLLRASTADRAAEVAVLQAVIKERETQGVVTAVAPAATTSHDGRGAAATRPHGQRRRPSPDRKPARGLASPARRVADDGPIGVIANAVDPVAEVA